MFLVFFSFYLIQPPDSLLLLPPLLHQGCRSSSPTTCRVSSYRRLWTTSAASPKASLCARMGTAGANAGWTFRSVTVRTPTWTLWRKTCFASGRLGGWSTRSLRNQVSPRPGTRAGRKERKKNRLKFWWIRLKCCSGIFASQKCLFAQNKQNTSRAEQEEYVVYLLWIWLQS